MSWRQLLSDRPLLGRGVPVALTAAALALGTGVCVGYPCFSTGLTYGLWLDECPATDLRLGGSLSAEGLVRGQPGWVSLSPSVRTLEGEGAYAWPVEYGIRRGYEADLSLLDEEEQPVAGFEVLDTDRNGTERRIQIQVPADLRDGDYVLRATLTGAGEEVHLDADLPFYAPALAHVASDRPLYKPGQEVLLRSVLLRRTDLTPLEGRPGVWRIQAPDGTEMLVERDRAGSYGVADTSFPLDTHADQGTWSATWESGQASDRIEFDVRPFRLPRLTAELTASDSWYAIGDEVQVDGVARYNSGAPVADAEVQVRVRSTEGRWPPPLDWEGPHTLRTDRQGRFTLELGAVPSDLLDKAVLSVSAVVTDETGESVSGSTRLILSQHSLAVEAVTELGDGLVGGFNNRAYLRVTRPDGRPLRDTDLLVGNPWEPDTPPREARTDADGVAALQLDPGDPVTVVIPPAPVRARPYAPPQPSLSSGRELARGRSLDLAERRAFDAVVPAVARCGDFASGSGTAQIGLRVSPSGSVAHAIPADDGPLGSCVAAAVRGVRLRPGPERTYQLVWRVPDTLRPSFNLSVSAATTTPDGVQAALSEAATRSRRCLERGVGTGGQALTVHWRTTDGSERLEASASVLSTSGIPATARACVARSFGGLTLDTPAHADALGAASGSLYVPVPPGTVQPQATTETGYELEIVATVDGVEQGRGRTVLPVGYIPALRLRATPSLASPGDTVEVELFRGPNFRGELPRDLALRKGAREVDRADVDQDTRRVTFTIPPDVEGFLHVEYMGARAVVFSKPQHQLEVALATDKAEYRPGETATLTVTTTAGGSPTQAGVGLIGVDSTLGQLAPLLGPDDYGRVTVRTKAAEPAFGSFDPRALALGQVRGENAAKAALLRVTSLPMDVAGDERTWASATVLHDDEEVRTRAFYRALEALIGEVRAWEDAAPDGELMTNAHIVELWGEVLAAEDASGRPVTDAFGRSLTLDLLPSDLLEQVDPRRVVADGTRLPEDVVAWTTYVDREVRR